MVTDSQGMSDGAKRLRENENEGWKLVPACPMPSIAETDSGYRATHDGAPDAFFTEDAYDKIGRESKQAPVPKPAPTPKAYPRPMAAHPVLPAGVQSLAQWGQTLCELPKVKSMRASYGDLVTQAATNQELRRYLTDFVMRHNGPSPKVRDLRAYLECIQFPTPLDGPPTYLAGSTTEERKYKY